MACYREALAKTFGFYLRQRSGYLLVAEETFE